MTERKTPESSPERGAPERPAIDWTHLSRQTMGDDALEAELLALFLKQALEFPEKLATGSDKARRDLAHTLKGAARAIGAFPLGDAAEDYEAALDVGRVEEPLRTLQTRLEEARETIAARLAGR